MFKYWKLKCLIQTRCAYGQRALQYCLLTQTSPQGYYLLWTLETIVKLEYIQIWVVTHIGWQAMWTLTQEFYSGHDRFLYLDTTKFKIFKRKMIAWPISTISKLGHKVLQKRSLENLEGNNRKLGQYKDHCWNVVEINTYKIKFGKN
jgi:hypothetical protein